MEQQHIPNARSLSFVTSWAIPCAAPVLSGLLRAPGAFYFLFMYFFSITLYSEFAQIFFHSCFVFPIFEFMTVEHKRNVFEDIFWKHLWGENGLLLPSVSTLDAAIIVFYTETNFFALNSLLEENGFTFLECVRTP